MASAADGVERIRAAKTLVEQQQRWAEAGVRFVPASRRVISPHTSLRLPLAPVCVEEAVRDLISGVNSPRQPPDKDAHRDMLNRLFTEFPPVTSGLIGDGHEFGVLFAESLRAFLNGTFAAAPVCAHASCERDLSGWVDWLGSEAPKGWDYWGPATASPERGAGR